MDKPKRKNDEPSRWGSFLDIVLLAKPFVWEVDGTPEECVEQLQKLAKAKTGFFNPTSRDVRVIEAYDQTFDFEICSERYGRGMSYDAAIAKGVISRDNGVDKTVIRGKVRLGMIMLLFYIGGFLGILWLLTPHQFAGLRDLWWTAVIIAVNVIYILMVVADYRKLSYCLRDTFSPENEKKKKNDGQA